MYNVYFHAVDFLNQMLILFIKYKRTQMIATIFTKKIIIRFKTERLAKKSSFLHNNSISISSLLIS